MEHQPIAVPSGIAQMHFALSADLYDRLAAVAADRDADPEALLSLILARMADAAAHGLGDA